MKYLNKNLIIALLFAIIFSFVSCTPTQKIRYDTNDIIPVSLSPIPIAVEITEFADIREEVAENELLFKCKQNQKKIDGVKKCINSEEFYKNDKESVSFQFSKVLAMHLNQSKVFSTTIFKDTLQTTNYYLTGKIVRFYGEQVFSTSALVGAQFGLIGALATSGTTSLAKIVIEVSELKLYNREGELVKYIGDFRKEYAEELHADAYCWCIFSNMNEKLKDFNYELARKLVSELRNVSF